MKRFSSPLLLAGGMSMASFVLGCRAAPNAQLESVAKDWCLVIRASQVIPVYPLTEDLVPGDVFVVETPIQNQQQQYKEKGFLPLDRHAARLDGLSYTDFYAARYFDDRYARGIPHARESADAAPKVANPDHADDAPKGGANTTPQPLDAPRAAFPTYSFDVSSGGGFQLALPVQRVPIGLSLMQADSATGSIALSDAHTYGLSASELLPKLESWAKTPRVLEKLHELAGLWVTLMLEGLLHSAREGVACELGAKLRPFCQRLQRGSKPSRRCTRYSR